MGARLVSLALSPVWGDLPDTARLVLVAMCQTAKDHPGPTQASGQYFAGHDTLVLTLTGQDPGLPPLRGTPEAAAALKRVKRAVAQLVAAGAIELVQSAHRGRHAIYQVTPDSRHMDLLPPFD